MSPEIVSLIHHVELNESGWWKKAVGQVIKGVLWTADVPLTIGELQSNFRLETGVELSEATLERQLHALSSQQCVSFMPGEVQRFKLTEQARAELAAAKLQAELLETQCREAFRMNCSVHCPELKPEQVWARFERALVEAVRIAGANLYHLLVDGNLEREGDWVAKFLVDFDTCHHDGLRKILAAFFSPKNIACRSQVLRLLTAHFFAEATQLSPETLASIEKKRRQRKIKVVLDTNFIFSILELHDNPGDDSALSLVEMAARTKGNLEIKLYVLPGTLDEAERALANQVKLIERVRTTRAIARAAIKEPLPSIARKFFSAAAQSPGLTAQTFFQPYIDDLRTILQAKGIEVLDVHAAVYNKRQDVVDDVLEEEEREAREVPDSKRKKGYETLLHDVVLWHAVNDRRPELVDSPFDAEYWAVSIDWRLIGFDRKKRSSGASRMPVVLHPSNFVQLVQFWVPRTTEMENSLIDGLRLPLFFQSFDPEDERATLQVLQAISRYENIGDLQEETVSSILANRALRSRLRDADAANEEIFELVQAEVLSEHKAALASLEDTKGKLNTMSADLTSERESRRIAKDALHATETELHTTQERLTEANEKFRQAEVASSQSSEEAAKAKCEALRTKYLMFAVVLPIAVGLFLAGVAYAITLWLDVARVTSMKWLIVPAVGLSPVALACALSPRFTGRHTELAGWGVARAVDWIGKKAVAGPFGLAAGAVYQGGVYDWIKTLPPGGGAG
ncbi:hypothetical protein [Cupriavidus sp. CP313]